jgi:ATP-dependent DNA helicase PIF1
VKKLIYKITEAIILNGKMKGNDVLLPRIPMIPTDMPFEFKLLQFPVRLNFAIIINKAQGQLQQVCGLSFEHSYFLHGQLCVSCSYVRKPFDLFVYVPE